MGLNMQSGVIAAYAISRCAGYSVIEEGRY